MNKPLRQLIAGAALGLASVAAMAGGNVNWSIGINLPPAGVVVSNGPVYYTPAPIYRAPPPVYYAPPPVYYAPEPIVYQPPAVVYRPAPVYGPPPGVYGGWEYQRPPHWHGGHGHRGRGWDRGRDWD
jgi:hypothetical protein